MADESEETRAKALEDASASILPAIPAEDDTPLTRNEVKALQEANTSFLLKQMRIMIEDLKKSNDPIGPTVPKTTNVVDTPLSADSGAKATPSTEESNALTHPNKPRNGTGEYSNTAPPNDYGGRIIPHPHINSHGPPPPLDIVGFVNWQASMKSHICSASTQLWRVI